MWRGSVCGLGVWVCQSYDHDVVLCGRNCVDVDARAEHVCRGTNRNVVLLNGRVACGKGGRGF